MTIEVRNSAVLNGNTFCNSSVSDIMLYFMCLSYGFATPGLSNIQSNPILPFCCRLYSHYYHKCNPNRPEGCTNKAFHQQVVRVVKIFNECRLRRSVRECVYDSCIRAFDAQVCIHINQVNWASFGSSFN